MSKDLFIARAKELYRLKDDFPCKSGTDWIGPYLLRTEACINFALCGSANRTGNDFADPLQEFTNSHPNATCNKTGMRQMLTHLLKHFGLRQNGDNYGDGSVNDPRWTTPNQLFIGCKPGTAINEPANWSHLWIEIRNIPHDDTWPQGCPNGLLLETVTGNALTIRRAQDQGEYTDDPNPFSLDVAVPVDDLTPTHFDTMERIHATRIMWNGGFSERQTELLEEPGFLDRIVHARGNVQCFATIAVPDSYDYVARRENRGARNLTGCSCTLREVERGTGNLLGVVAVVQAAG